MRSVTLPLIIGWFLGAASGLWFMHVWHSPEMHARHMHRMRDRLVKELKLSPDQRDKVDAILKTSHQKMDDLFAQARAQEAAIHQSTRAQIRELLNPDQQKTMADMNARMDARKKRDEQFDPRGLK